MAAGYSEDRLLEIWEKSRSNWHRPQLPRPVIDETEDGGSFPFRNYRIVIDTVTLAKGDRYLENLFDHLIVHYLFCPRSLEMAGRL
ncbi:MAG TPA: VWA domain-containing protein, partial [Methanothrix sp.]|nr:VWA domain-containing protein [Methanothrix sp.]